MAERSARGGSDAAYGNKLVLFLRQPGFPAAALLSSILAGTYYWLFALVWTDDALIYFRLARNVADGLGPVLNAADTHGSATSLIWVYMLAMGMKLIPGIGLPWLAKLLAVAFITGASLFLCHSFRRPLGIQALLAPLALVSVPLFRLLPGLEIPLVLFAMCLAHWCWFSLRSLPLAAAAVSFSFFCRGDAILLGIPIAVHFLISEARDPSRRPEIWTEILRASCVAAAVLISGFVIQLTLTGQLLPETLQAKIIQGLGHGPLYSSQAMGYATHALGGNNWFVVFVLVGLFRAGIPGLALATTALLHTLAFSLMSIADYPWYSWILQLSVRLLMVLGLAALVQSVFLSVKQLLGGGQSTANSSAHPPTWAALAISFGISTWLLLDFTRPPHSDHDPSLGGAGFMTTYHKIAQTVCGSISEDRASGKPPTLLGEEIGAIGFFCPDIVIRDVNGLASPGLTLENLNDWDHWVERYAPEFLSIRGRQGLDRIFSGVGQESGLLYHRIMIHHEPDFVPVTVYQRNAEPGVVESLSHLEPLLRSSPMGPDTKLIWLPGNIRALFAHAPAEIRAKIPEWATQVELGFGILPGPTESHGQADGVTFQIIGIQKSGEERRLLRRHLDALVSDHPVENHTVSVDLSDPSIDQLRLIVRTGPTPNWDWSYWSKIEFETESASRPSAPQN